MCLKYERDENIIKELIRNWVQKPCWQGIKVLYREQIQKKTSLCPWWKCWSWQMERSNAKWLRRNFLEKIKNCISIKAAFPCPFRTSLQHLIVEFKMIAENLWEYTGMWPRHFQAKAVVIKRAKLPSNVLPQFYKYSPCCSVDVNSYPIWAKITCYEVQ